MNLNKNPSPVGTKAVRITHTPIDRRLYAWRVGERWASTRASLLQIKGLINHVGADPAKFVKRFQKDGTTVLGHDLFEAVTGWRHEYDECVMEFWEVAFEDPTELNDPIIATAFLEGAMAAWYEVKNAVSA